MPYNTLQRRDSWPPTQVRLHADQADEITDEDLDSNPFSYFLTRPEDESDEDADVVDLSAGIEEPSSGSSREPIIRSVSPSALQRKKLQLSSAVYSEEDEEDEEYIRDLTTAFAVPVTLKDYQVAFDLKNSKAAPVPRKRDHEPERKTQPATRGRGILKLPSGRGRGRTRSLSAQRPHLWREPSPDVWSIPEEEDEDMLERLGTPALSDDGMKVQGPASGDGRENAPLETPKKEKKRVRWAL